MKPLESPGMKDKREDGAVSRAKGTHSLCSPLSSELKHVRLQAELAAPLLSFAKAYENVFELKCVGVCIMHAHIRGCQQSLSSFPGCSAYCTPLNLGFCFQHLPAALIRWATHHDPCS